MPQALGQPYVVLLRHLDLPILMLPQPAEVFLAMQTNPYSQHGPYLNPFRI
jgi:hypothetical protein